MTSPLPAQSAKSALAESKGSSKADFLSFCAPQKKSEESQSFESLISKNEERQDRQDELEEADKSKKRRKQIDAAAVAAQASSDTCIQTTPDLENPTGIAIPHEVTSDKQVTQVGISSSVAKYEIQSAGPASKAGQGSDKTSASVASPNSNNPEALANLNEAGLKDVASSSEPNLPPTSKSDVQDNNQLQAIDVKESSRSNGVDQKIDLKNMAIIDSARQSDDGTKPAVIEDDMVSLATFEDSQASSAPKAGAEPSITSANRLVAMSESSERTAIRSTESAGSDSNTSPENFLAANPAILQTDLSGIQHKGAVSQAASVFKTLAPELEKFQQSGQSQLQLELPVGDNESVKIRLHLRAGEIRSTFITESPELRDALQKAWPDFTATHRAQGIRFGESQFQDSFARNQDAASEQGRQRQSPADIPQREFSASQQVKPRQRVVSQSLAANSSVTSTVNLWA